MKPSISIAMATYNGAAYLREQLDSLLVQERLPNELVACDDGSSDETVDILQNFADQSPFPVHIHRNDANLGYVRNFLKAASLCSGDWISFCDQDDVWLSDNLSSVEKAIESTPGAVLVAHRAEVVDKTLRVKGQRVPAFPSNNVIHPLKQPLWFRVPGFCCTFDASLVHDFPYDYLPMSFPSPRLRQSADKRIVWLANTLGKTVLLHEPKALYRRHGNNVSKNTENTGRGASPSLNRSKRFEFNKAKAKAAADYSAELERFLQLDQNKHREAFLRAGAEYYRQLAQWYLERATLYEGNRAFRLKTYLKLVASGAYSGETRLGIRSLLRDAWACIEKAEKESHGAAV